MAQGNSQLLNKWRSAVEAIISDVTDLIENRLVFNRVVDMVNENKKLQQDNLYWDYLKLNHGSAMVLGISRQVDSKKSTYGLIKLLEDISKNSSIITIDWFTDSYKRPTKELGKLMGEKDFRENFGTGSCVDKKVIDKDIQALKNATKIIREFRHTRIAHKNKDKSLSFSLNFSEIDKALGVLEKLVIKYQLLLNQVGFTEGLLPVIQYDWEEIFRKAWVKK